MRAPGDSAPGRAIEEQTKGSKDVIKNQLIVPSFILAEVFNQVRNEEDGGDDSWCARAESLAPTWGFALRVLLLHVVHGV